MTEEDKLLYRLIKARGMVAEAKLRLAAKAAQDAGISLEEAMLVRGLISEDQLAALEGLAKSSSESMATLDASAAREGTPVPRGNDPLIGQEIGGVRLDALLGEGGMGRVYRGEDVDLGRTVALKMLNKTFSMRPDQVERFKREARSAARLEHPNVVQVYRVGEHEGQHYIVMQFIEGESLIEKLKRDGAMGTVDATKMLLAMVRGMQVAHENEVIHRDIKPDNIMVTLKGEVKIADFGLARDSEAQSEISQTGQVLGTPYYMSPEQADGQPVDLRTDIYSLGATYYHMLTGRRPFEGDTPLQVMLKHLRETPVPPHQVRRTVPEGVSRLCLLMMEKKPYDRPESCEAVAGEIVATLRALGEDVEGGTTIVTKKTGKGVLLLVVALLLGLAGVGYLILSAKQFEREAESALALATKDAGAAARRGDYVAAARLLREAGRPFPDAKVSPAFEAGARAYVRRGREAWAEARDAAETAAAKAAKDPTATEESALWTALETWRAITADVPADGDAEVRREAETVAAALAELRTVEGRLLEVAKGGDAADAAAIVARWSAEDQPPRVREAARPFGGFLAQAQAVAAAVASARTRAQAGELDAALAEVAPHATDDRFAEPAKELKRNIASDIDKVAQRWRDDEGRARKALARGRFGEAAEAARPFTEPGRHRGVSAVADDAKALVDEIAGARADFAGAFAALRTRAVRLARDGQADEARALLAPYVDSDVAELAAAAKAALAQAGFEAETPAGFVFVPAAGGGAPVYCMAREVTNAEYAAFLAAMAAEGAARPAPRHWGAPTPPEPIGAQPVRWVTRADALAYAEWKGRAQGGRYRLPTDGEWSAAAGSTPFPWGDDVDRVVLVVGIGTPADAGVDDGDATVSGVRGLGGNVAEWTSTTVDGQAVVRGGSFDRWAKPDPVARILVRAGAVALPHVGFRLVRDVE